MEHIEPTQVEMRPLMRLFVLNDVRIANHE
jgi:hypothetical protein